MAVSFNGNGGTVIGDSSKIVTFNMTYGELPSATRTGYTFLGWRTAETNGTQVKSDTLVINQTPHTLYAHWNNKTITCQSGTFLQANEETCSTCIPGSYCTGGTFTISEISQGIKACPGAYTSTAGAKKEAECYITVDAGWGVDPAKTDKKKCANGTYSTGGKVFYGKTLKCGTCTEIGNGFSGWTSNGTSANSCAFECKNGYSVNGRSCIMSYTTATLKPGREFNSIIKNLAGDATNIQYIKRATSLPSNVIITGISIQDSAPIYAWYDNGTIYYYSEKETIFMNQDSISLFNNLSSVKTIDLAGLDTSKTTLMGGMFAGCSSLTNLDLSHFNTSKVTSMPYMFQNCSSLRNLDVSYFDTSNVANMTSMFDGCSSLTNLDLSHFNTSKVTHMPYMFQNCSSLISLNLSYFDTSNAYDMTSMFDRCSSLTNLDLSHFNTSKVTNMEAMFFECKSLTSLDISHFDTSNVVNMALMFNGCSSLTNLDLSHFNTSKVTDMAIMFAGCSNLTTIYASSSFNTNKVTDDNSINMFKNTPKLVGGNGTVWNSNYTDKERAKIDKPGQKGYFTIKCKSGRTGPNCDQEEVLNSCQGTKPSGVTSSSVNPTNNTTSWTCSTSTTSACTYTCPSGKKCNSSNTNCEDITCNANYYLNGNTCSKCGNETYTTANNTATSCSNCEYFRQKTGCTKNGWEYKAIHISKGNSDQCKKTGTTKIEGTCDYCASDSYYTKSDRTGCSDHGTRYKTCTKPCQNDNTYGTESCDTNRGSCSCDAGYELKSGKCVAKSSSGGGGGGTTSDPCDAGSYTWKEVGSCISSQECANRYTTTCSASSANLQGTPCGQKDIYRISSSQSSATQANLVWYKCL